MPMLTDFLKNSVCFETPHRLTDVSSWHGHIPFAFAIVQMLRPKIFVELGTHKGDSYCAFCQAIEELKLNCACHAVDRWEGDKHAGFYGKEVLEELHRYHDPLYGHFSNLLKMPFDDALSCFPDASIELLHIDGFHSYKAVKHDFCSWLPKMGKRGVVLLHDTNVRERNFGVWKLWEELKDTYPSFEFTHSHGLGVLGTGSDFLNNVNRLLASDKEEASQISRFFSGLGDRVVYGLPIGNSEEMKIKFNPDSPKVSVIIPAYNHEKYLKETIYSVLKQTVTDFELIIINDGSADKSEEVIKSVEDERIRYFYQDNQGAHNALNRGIKLAKGKYISILNSDDVYCPDRFETFLNILEQDDSVHAVFSHIEYIDEEGNFIRYKKGSEDNWTNHDPETSFKGEENIFLNLLAGNFLVSTSNLFCRRSVFQKIGFFSNLRYAHDYEFFLRLCYHFNVRIVNKPLLKYRIHSANTIKENEAETDFEVGIILSDLLLNYDLDKIFPDYDIYSVMVKFFNSVKTYRSERMIMTLLLFGRKHNIHDVFFKLMMENTENPFRKNCIDHFQKHLDAWRESQKAWGKWSDTNERLIETDKKLAETADEAKKWWLSSQEAWHKWTETNERLVDTDKKLSETTLNCKKTWKKWREINERLIESDNKLAETADEAEKWRLNSQEVWEKWSETNEQLAERDKKLLVAADEINKWRLNSQESEKKWSETNDCLADTEKKLTEAEEEIKMWWMRSQEAWKKWSETNDRLIAADKKSAEASEEARKWRLNSQEAREISSELNERLAEVERRLSEMNQNLIEKTRQMSGLLNSASFRLGKTLIWPVRKLLNFFAK